MPLPIDPKILESGIFGDGFWPSSASYCCSCLFPIAIHHRSFHAEGVFYQFASRFGSIEAIDNGQLFGLEFEIFLLASLDGVVDDGLVEHV